MTTFKERVLEAVASIPKGETRSYKEVAEAAGSLGASRAVGNIMKGNHNPRIPCHRVIKSDGSLGGYNQGEARKKLLLEKERTRHIS